jgi:hypothetical protein
MADRTPATSHAQIIGAVASLQTEMSALVGIVGELKGEVHRLNSTVGTHQEQIANWKRDGKWLGSALIGIGAAGAFLANVLRDWFMHWATR